MICPACSRSELEIFFDAGELPVFVNVLHDTRAAARSAPRGRIRLGGCNACDFVHNVDFDPSLVAYAPGYENSLHGSPTFRAWAAATAAELVERHGLQQGRAVEIGGGRGEFMQLLVDAGLAAGLVMDPSSPDDCLGASDAGQGGARFTIERRLFEPNDATGDTTGDNPPTRLLLTRHVLEHIETPRAFVELLAGAAREAGAGLYVEVPNGLWTLRDLGIWDVIYEHCSYFTPHALAALLQSVGAESGVTETFGGQFLSAEAAVVGPAPPDAKSARPNAPHDGAALRAAFGDAHGRVAARWRTRIADAGAGSRRLAIWGAGSKGATFLNTIDPDGVIVCAVDVNERKVGRFIAGCGHEIVAPDALADRGVEGIIVMNPLYAEEIAAMSRSAGVEAEVLVV